jgi:tRNA threonylcarbamoyladenosine modification (KEOPS) complex Cgi121 subunit
MKKYLFVLSVLSILFVSNFNIVFANCSSYGGSTTCTDEKDYDLQKRVKESDSDKKEQKITGIKKGENFIFVFKVENYKNEEETLKLIDNLPSEFERVSGIGFTEEIKLNGKESKELEMVVKVKDSEFENKTNFEKCVVNKAYLKKGEETKDTSTATVCFGEGSANGGVSSLENLPKTGAEETFVAIALVLIVSGVVLKKFSK